MLFDYYQLEFSINRDEIQYYYWEGAAKAEPVDEIKMVFEFFNANEIKIGVISNMAFSK